MTSVPGGRQRPEILTLLALALLVAGFGMGVAADRAGVFPGALTGQPLDVAPTFSVFWQAWNLVEQHYVDRSAIDATSMTYGATSGMLDSLGDAGHTRFLSPEARQEQQEALAGRLEGIGAEIGLRDGRPTIVAPIPGSPAQQAGIRAGDVLERVDGQDVAGLRLDQIVRLVRGPAGTSVTLTVLHAGETQLTDITVVRAKLTVPSVSWARLSGTEVAHVLITQFAEQASEELVTALAAARSSGATALILDLRNNPGGLRDEAIDVASQFLSEGTVLVEQDAQGKRTEFSVKPDGAATDMPLVALINEGSASAAEIVAGALQDHQRARVVGATSFGTGTVLSLFELTDGSGILLGTEEWLTPHGRRIWHRGIEPDLPVALPVGAFPLIPREETSLPPEQLQASDDTQLLRALQELRGAPVP